MSTNNPLRPRTRRRPVVGALALALVIEGLSVAALAQLTSTARVSTMVFDQPDADWAWWAPEEAFDIRKLKAIPLDFYDGKDLKCEYASGRVDTMTFRNVTLGAMVHPHPSSVRTKRWEELLNVGSRRFPLSERMLEVGIVPYVEIEAKRLYLVPAESSIHGRYILACDSKSFHEKLMSSPPTYSPTISILLREPSDDFAEGIRSLLEKGRALDLLRDPIPVVDKYRIPGNRPTKLSDLLGELADELVRTRVLGFLGDLSITPQDGLVVGVSGFGAETQIWLGPEDLPARLQAGEQELESRRVKELQSENRTIKAENQGLMAELEELRGVAGTQARNAERLTALEKQYADLARANRRLNAEIDNSRDALEFHVAESAERRPTAGEGPQPGQFPIRDDPSECSGKKHLVVVAVGRGLNIFGDAIQDSIVEPFERIRQQGAKKRFAFVKIDTGQRITIEFECEDLRYGTQPGELATLVQDSIYHLEFNAPDLQPMKDLSLIATVFDDLDDLGGILYVTDGRRMEVYSAREAADPALHWADKEIRFQVLTLGDCRPWNQEAKAECSVLESPQQLEETIVQFLGGP